MRPSLIPASGHALFLAPLAPAEDVTATDVFEEHILMRMTARPAPDGRFNPGH